MPTQAEKAQTLLELHHGPEILVLANVWDCASARIVEEAGFPAIATSSAGVAFSLGYPDGQRIPLHEMLAAVVRIVRSVQVPVTADLEGGYGDISDTAAGLLRAGAVGLNLEDAEGQGANPVLLDVKAQTRKIQTLRRISDEAGVRIVINARTDIYLRNVGDPASRFDRACERLHAYIDAGADCGFIPGVSDEALICRFVEELKFPLNVLAVAGTPPIPRLQEIGVRRVSMGSGLARAAMTLTRGIARQLKESGTYGSMFDGSISHTEANRLFQDRHKVADMHVSGRRRLLDS